MELLLAEDKVEIVEGSEEFELLQHRYYLSRP